MNVNKLSKAIQKVTESDMVWNKETKDFDDTKVTPPTFIMDGKLFVSTEHNESYLFADYYGEYRGGYPWINPKLEKFADKHNCHWEWQNPGCICLCDN